MQAKFEDSENSWTVDAKSIDPATFDLSVKNPNKADEAALRDPKDIIAEMAAHRTDIFSRYDEKLQSFLDFVLGQYVKQGVGELDQDKLGALLQLKYHTIDDAASQLGSVPLIRDTFLGFQQHLYAADK